MRDADRALLQGGLARGRAQKAPDMTAMLPPDILEASRLTREGRLTEATALLQRLLGHETPPSTPSDTVHGTAAPPAGRHPRVLDVDPETGKVTGPGPAKATHGTQAFAAGMRSATGLAGSTLPQMPEALRGFLDRVNQGGLGPELGGLTIPSTCGSEAVPLVVMLHGCTQSPDDFAAGTRMNVLAEEHGVLVVYPGQTPAANAQKCWNWFSPGDQERDRGEPALIAGITRQVMRDHAIDPARVYVAGLSAGGAAAAIMGVAYPDLYAAIGVHSGLACGAARDIPSAFAAMRQGVTTPRRSDDGGRRIVPTIVFHADQDGTVNPRNGDQVIAQAKAAAAAGLQARTERGQVPGGHAYSRTLHTDPGGKPILEQWVVHGGGHAWSGGSTAGSYTDPRGPDASREMLRFFLDHSHPAAA
jgi:poly(hydroxyalkanoate) depolymerase family esterase